MYYTDLSGLHRLGRRSSERHPELVSGSPQITFYHPANRQGIPKQVRDDAPIMDPANLSPEYSGVTMVTH